MGGLLSGQPTMAVVGVVVCTVGVGFGVVNGHGPLDLSTVHCLPQTAW